MSNKIRTKLGKCCKDGISKVAKDIISLELKPGMTLAQVEGKFYRLMRKYGIRQGTKSGNGVVCDNFEWSMCKELFLSRVRDYFEFDRFLLKAAPKDLQCY
jgi:hypothetical protein